MAEFKFDGEVCYIDNILKNIIDAELKEVVNDDDLFIVVIGKERSGKTTLAKDTICPYVASVMKTKWNINNIQFTSQDFIEFGLNAPKYTPILLDESRRDLSRSKRGGAKEHFSNYMSECGDQNQINVFILPDYTSLDRDLAKRRLKILIEVIKYYSPRTKKYERRFKLIKMKNYNNLDYYWEKRIPSFPTKMVYATGKFVPQLKKLNKDYKEKKMEMKKLKYSKILKETVVNNDPKLITADICEKFFNYGISLTKISKIVGIKPSTLRGHIQKLKKMQENI